MANMEPGVLEAARRILRAGSRSSGEAVLTGKQARAVLEELLRLQQGNDRLRRQNKRVRRRLVAATGEDAPGEDIAADDTAADDIPAEDGEVSEDRS